MAVDVWRCLDLDDMEAGTGIEPVYAELQSDPVNVGFSLAKQRFNLLFAPL